MRTLLATSLFFSLIAASIANAESPAPIVFAPFAPSDPPQRISDSWPCPPGERHRLEFPYYFRPYQFSDIRAHQSAPFSRSASNPYDNRFFQNIYATVEAK